MLIDVKVVTKYNDKPALFVVENYDQLKRRVFERYNIKDGSIVRLSDGAEITDNSVLKITYDRHSKARPNEELVLVILNKDETFNEDDRENFEMAGNYKIANLINELKNAESVDICFLVDCTGSMTRYIQEVKKVIKAAYEKLKSIFHDLKLRSAFVGYRDYDKNGNDKKGRIEILKFTSDVDKFEKFVNEIKAEDGADDCEDVFGGLESVNTLDWINKSRVLLHICDAPCHGSKYHDNKVTDDHKKGDPKNLDIKTLLKNLADKNIDYYFTRINESTDKMISEFNKEYEHISGSSKITTYKLNQADELLDKLCTSITLTINNTQQMTYSSDGGGIKKLKEIAVDETKNNFDEESNFKEYNAEIYKFEFNGSIDSFKNLKDKNKKIEDYIVVKREETQVKICHTPFSKGKLRYAYASKLKINREFKKFVAKDSLYEDIKYDTYEHHKQSIILQIIAKYLAETFLKETRSFMNVKFLDVYLVQLKDSGKYYSMEEYLEGKFLKYSNNLGYLDQSLYSYTLDSFLHWSYDKTDKYLIVSDLQGFKSLENECYILTDPAICCIHRQFTSTDLGEIGIKNFFKKHQCNDHCVDLKLTRYKNWQPEGIRQIHDKATKIKPRK